ncbi:hypothetical protein PPSIR1_30350 [Plesiocystis pacifica SIR-1]|uniref:Uncharacterized protein n=1 Tax=Plesiocystis pacifica SIR-1 TaxID=391625 RepID=A6FZ49_9BACT|nr:hypothetical protein [Plesiocystis pacifica]EDM81204.1 hypothetical protein PPSIR1_30350 [Plesiocystis pacifica SIR-1]
MANQHTTNGRSKAPLYLAMLSLTAIVACDLEPEQDDDEDRTIITTVTEDGIYEVDATPDDELGAREPERLPPLLARVQRGTSAVEWRAPDDSRGEVMLMISGTEADTPIIDMDTAETLSPVEAWVAIADAPRAVPERLLARATEADLELLDSPARIDSLRAEVHEKVAQALELGYDGAAAEHEPHAWGTCTASQVATARSVYGKGYTSAATCGNNTGLHTTHRDYWYCNAGDCDYDLALTDIATGACMPTVTGGAAIVGDLTAVTMRVNAWNNHSFSTPSHRIRGFAYECHGDNPVQVHMDYGSDDWDWNLASGYYVGVTILGSPMLPGRAKAINIVSLGSWADGIGQSGASYKSSNFSITSNAAPGDHGIFCTDAQKRLDMEEGPTGNGHEWCIGSCSVGNCWDY